jgi:hypothetical protein
MRKLKLFKLTNLFAVGDFEDQLHNEAQLDELINFSNSDYKITFCIRSPNLPIYKFPKESLSESSEKENVNIEEDSPKYSASGERIYPEFLHVEGSIIINGLGGDATDGLYFSRAYYIKDETGEDGGVEVEREEAGCRICIFNEHKTTDTFNEYELCHCLVNDLNLYVGAELCGAANRTQVISDDSKTKKGAKLVEVTDIAGLRNALGIYEEIPKSVRMKLEAFPELDEKDFHFLAYLRFVYEKYWTDYAFKEYLSLRILESDDIRADRFLKWNYKEVDKKIRSRIRYIDSNVATELLRLFVNEELSKNEKLPEGVKRKKIKELAQKEKIFEDGKTPGERCAQIAEKLVRPAFEERSDGHFKRSKHKFYPIKLWILHHLALFLWEDVDPNDHESHHFNTDVKSLVLLINNKRSDQISNQKAMSSLEKFLKVCPDLKYFPNISFTVDEAKYVATLIRPRWAYAKNR